MSVCRLLQGEKTRSNQQQRSCSVLWKGKECGKRTVAGKPLKPGCILSLRRVPEEICLAPAEAGDRQNVARTRFAYDDVPGPRL